MRLRQHDGQERPERSRPHDRNAKRPLAMPNLSLALFAALALYLIGLAIICSAYGITIED